MNGSQYSVEVNALASGIAAVVIEPYRAHREQSQIRPLFRLCL